MKIKNASAKLKKRFDNTSDLDDKLFLLKKGAKKGYLWALGPLGQEYSTGENLPTDMAKTISLWSLAAEKGSNKARIALGHLYETGEGVSIDLSKAMELYLSAAENGFSLGMIASAFLYENDTYTGKDLVKAVNWYEKLLESTDDIPADLVETAKSKLAVNYFSGDYITENVPKALLLMEELAINDDIFKHMLGEIYRQGLKVEKDTQKAIEYLEVVAKSGEADAQYGLGAMYYSLDHKEKGLKWLNLAANQGNTASQFLIGGHYATEEDYAKSHLFIERAAGEGHSLAKVFLGTFYFFGFGIEVDYEKGVSYFSPTAKDGESFAQNLLGYAYYEGKGVEVDIERAIFWWKLSAKQNGIGSIDSQLCLGQAYYFGHGVTKNISTAMEWFDQGARNGSEEAQEYLNILNKDEEKIITFPDNKSKSFDEKWLSNMLSSYKAADKDLQKLFINQIDNDCHVFEHSIEKLIEIDETNEIEFKESFSVPSKKGADGKTVKQSVITYAVLQEICAFLNTNDGIILIGIIDGKNTFSRKPEIKGIEFDNFKSRDNYTQKILNTIRTSFGATVASLLNITYESFDDKTICRIECQKSSLPVYCKFKGKDEKPFVRYGSSSAEPTQKEWADHLKTYFG